MNKKKQIEDERCASSWSWMSRECDKCGAWAHEPCKAFCRRDDCGCPECEDWTFPDNYPRREVAS